MKWIPKLYGLKSNSTITSSNNSIKVNDFPEIIIRNFYAGKLGKQLLKCCLKKVKCCIDSNIKFGAVCGTKKSLFIVLLNQKFLMTKGTVLFVKICSGCSGYYMGKTKTCLITRITDDDTKETEPPLKDHSKCEIFQDCCCLYFLLSLFDKNEHDHISLKSHTFKAVLRSYEILDGNPNLSQLAFLEAYYIKNHDSFLTIVSKPQKKLYYLINF